MKRWNPWSGMVYFTTKCSLTWKEVSNSHFALTFNELDTVLGSVVIVVWQAYVMHGSYIPSVLNPIRTVTLTFDLKSQYHILIYNITFCFLWFIRPMSMAMKLLIPNSL